MKKILLVILLVLSSAGLTAQSAPSNEAFVKPDSPAEFPGGINAFNKFVSNNLVLRDTTAKDLKIYVSYVVDTDGGVDNVMVVKDPGFGLGEEAVRVVKLSPKWNPALKDGKPVRSAMVFPIRIKIEPNSEAGAADDLVDGIKPEFPGGPRKFYELVVSKIRPNKISENSAVRVVAYFIVEKDGSMSNIRIEGDPDHDVAREIIRSLKKISTKWKPGTVGGLPVRASYSLPIQMTFKGN
ncbi:MAG: hypothetical protein EOO45_03240 [Flavobacterium sp.]|nr:MAG: hypothetical protein EOO45_03240 [Flavobacterium sp.]